MAWIDYSEMYCVPSMENFTAEVKTHLLRIMKKQICHLEGTGLGEVYILGTLESPGDVENDQHLGPTLRDSDAVALSRTGRSPQANLL